jgi:hypothetical protein
MKIIFIILIIFFTLLHTQLQSQGSFEFLYENEFNYTCYDVIETPEKEYVLALLEMNTSIQQLILIKLSQDGEIILSKLIYPQENGVAYHKIVLIPSGYLIFGVNNNFALPDSDLYFLKTDKDFNVTNTGIVNTGLSSSSWAHLLQIKKDNQGNILILGTEGGVGNYLARFTPEGNLLSILSTFPFNTCGMFFDLSPIYENKVAYIGIGDICILDSLFQVTANLEKEPFEMQSTSHYSYNEKSLYVAGRHHVVGTPDDHGVVILRYDENLQNTGIAIVDTPVQNVILYPAASNGVQQCINSEIIVGGTWNIDYTTLFSSNKSYFFLSRFDTALTHIETQKFGGEAYYSMNGLLSTSDGGCLMYGYRYDETTGSGLDPFVKKLNMEELTANLTNGIVDPAIGYRIFPNPGTENVSVETPLGTEAYLTVKSPAGQIFFSGQVNDKDILYTHSWPSGYYLYQFIDSAGKISPVYKWLKLSL